MGGLSALTAVLYLIPFVLRFALVWAWNLVLFILWITLFGLVGNVCVSAAVNPDVMGALDLVGADRFCSCTSNKTRMATVTSSG